MILPRKGSPPANHKRVYRLMKVHGLLLAKHSGHRPGRSHDGKVVMMRSDLRWCSDGFEFTCWNGEIVRGAFVLDAHDREVIAWRAAADAGISGSDIRDMMLEAVEARFGGDPGAASGGMALGQRPMLETERGLRHELLGRPSDRTPLIGRTGGRRHLP